MSECVPHVEVITRISWTQILKALDDYTLIRSQQPDADKYFCESDIIQLRNIAKRIEDIRCWRAEGPKKAEPVKSPEEEKWSNEPEV